MVFCTILSVSLVTAYILFSTAPFNPHTSIFAAGFGFAYGFLGLGALTLIFFDRIGKHLKKTGENEAEFFKKVIKEMPFFFFSLLFFFGLAIYMGIFILVLGYIKNAFV